jgi:hypothetical protein
MLDSKIRPLKSGDKIVLEYNGSKRRIKKIDRITPKGQIVVDAIRFSPNGKEMTSNFPHYSLDYVTSQDIEDFKRRTMVKKCQGTKLEDLNLDQLNRIYKIMQEGV